MLFRSVADIYETSVCPLARIMRRELKKRGVTALKVVYSKEPAMSPLSDEEQPETAETGHRRRSTPASNAFVPPVAGLIMAGEVVRGIVGH